MSRHQPILLLTTNLSYGRGLANALVAAGFEIKEIVLEGGVPRLTPTWPLRLYHALGLNPFPALARLCPVTGRRWLSLVEKGCRREAILRFEHEIAVDCNSWPQAVPLRRCDRLNDLEPSYFESFEDCLFVVFFTGILRPHVFGASRIGAINCHPAVLPAYRGAYVEFWQLYHDARDTFGYTLHRIDPHVDTGPILFQRRTHYEGWNPWELRTINLLDCIRHYPTFLEDFFAGRIEERPQPPTTMKTYRVRDLFDAPRLEYFRRCLGRTR